ncbi:MAG TPA: phage terminase small subunit P27 family [Candidatus Scybalomonas excrementigallinarum]|nr:phage terminase small subunit P27 family [Candidatus Scybalomonas excrementigallinarum]
MARPPKLTTDSKSRKEQRERTENLIEKSKELSDITKTPPKELRGTIAGYAWSRLMPELEKMKFVKAPDKDILVLLCMNIQLYREAFESIKENGIQTKIFKTVVSPTTGEVLSKDFQGFKQNTAVQTLTNATTKIESLSNKLGLSPVARASILEKVKSEEPTKKQSVKDLLFGDDEE